MSAIRRKSLVNGKIHAIAIVSVIVLISLFVVARVHAAWQEATTPPVSFPPGFNVLLNTTAVSQTKAGLLIVNGTFTAQNELCVGGISGVCQGQVGATSKISWNGDARSSWAEAAVGRFVHLRPPSLPPAQDAGYANLIGPSDLSLSNTALFAKAGILSGIPTYGVAGYASSLSGGSELTVGIAGEASANSPEHAGVFGTADFGVGSQTYAGYFVGNVRITAGNDLVVGSRVSAPVAIARANPTSEVCLNSDCRSSWDVGGSSLWSLVSGARTLIWPSDISRSVSIGGTDQNAQFVVQVLADRTADVTVRGNTTIGNSMIGKLVVGTPTALLGPSLTCGDGMCNGLENDIFGNVNYCPADCDITAPGNIANLSSSINASNQAIFTWTNPSNLDFSGTRVVQSIGAQPNGPRDPGTDVAKPTATYTSPPLLFDTQYYFGFYAYDATRNYSSGVIAPIFIPSGGGGGEVPPPGEEEPPIIRGPPRP